MPFKNSKGAISRASLKQALAFSVVALLLLVCVLIQFWADGTASTEYLRMKAILSTLISLLLNLAATLAVFFFASLLFLQENIAEQKVAMSKAIEEALGRPSTLRPIKWEELIRDSNEIDFVVQGWNGWAEQLETISALKAFFAAGGKFRLYVCHPDSEQATQERSLMAARTGKTPAAVVTEISGTYSSIKDVRDSIPADERGNSSIEVFHTNKLNWYFACRFKNNKKSASLRSRNIIILSIYSHTKFSPWDMPAQILYPDAHPELEGWFEKELEHLKSDATVFMHNSVAGKG